MSRKSENLFREIHRYLGFFLAGIMAVYAISGIVLTFRNTDWLRKEVAVTKQLEPGLTAENLGQALGRRRFEVTGQKGEHVAVCQWGVQHGEWRGDIIPKSGSPTLWRK